MPVAHDIGSLWTRDDNRRLFMISSKGEAEIYNTDSKQPKIPQFNALNLEGNRPTTPELQDGTYADPENEGLDPPK